MNITYKQSGNSCTVFVSGELDEHTSVYTRNTLDKIISELNFGSQVVFDFSGLTFMDSTGIGVLLGRYKRHEKRGVSFVIKNTNTHIDRILKMTGIYTLIPNVG